MANNGRLNWIHWVIIVICVIVFIATFFHVHADAGKGYSESRNSTYKKDAYDTPPPSEGGTIPKGAFEGLAGDLAEISDSLIDINTPEWKTVAYKLKIAGTDKRGVYNILSYSPGMLVLRNVETNKHRIVFLFGYFVELEEIE